jgi:DNA-binding NarL/FixJ family response regulator
METRVVVAYDHHVFRQCLRAWLEGEDGLTVVGESCDGQHALEEVERARPDLLLIDLWLPCLSGLEVTRRVARAGFSTRTLILSTSGSSISIEEVVRAGGFGFLSRDSALDDLSSAIRSLKRGDACSPSLGTAHGTNGSEHAPVNRNGLIGKLTSREIEILKLIATDLSGKEIACRLDLSTRTVDTHRGHMMRKLGVKKVSGLVRIAIWEGLVQP